MAEAIVNTRLSEDWHAYSAGTDPVGSVHPKARKALAEIGIEHKGISKPIDALPKVDFDVVITVCDDAAENCPVWLGQGSRFHMGFPDPAGVTGDEQAVMDTFRQVRDAILMQVPKFLIEKKRLSNKGDGKEQA